MSLSLQMYGGHIRPHGPHGSPVRLGELLVLQVLPLLDISGVSDLRFRTGCHNLAIDQGRRGNQVPRLDRFCQMCNTRAIGDERHIDFECPALHDLRARYDSLFRPSITTMRQFMWQDDLVQVAQFIRLSLGRVNTDLDTVNI